jgi:putative membrane protein
MIELNKIHKTYLYINLLILVLFTPIFLINKNLEFLVYIITILFYLILIGLSLNKIKYSISTFTCLTIWSFLHMAGGGVLIGEERLYDLMLFQISDNLQILKYDQAVHTFGFFAATLIGFDLLKGYLKTTKKGLALSIILVMVGTGFGALNEVLEFLTGFLDKHAGIGGYLNTMLDLCFNLLGAIFGVIYINLYKNKNN